MFGVIKRAALAAVVVANLALGAAPAFAASGPTTVSISPATLQVQPGATFTVDVAINTTGQSLGFQFAVNYDPSLVTLNSVTEGSWLSTWAAANGGSTISGAPWTPLVAPGQSKVGGIAVVGATGNGPTGQGQLATLHFTALSAVNGIDTITLSNLLVNGIANSDLTTQTGAVTVGTPPQADLIVTNASTTAVTGSPTEYNVSFQVKNQGNLDAGASTASVAITGATPASATASVAALTAGTSSATLTAGPFTLNSGVSLANVTITADSANVIAESNEANNTGTTAYQYSALSASGNTNVAANLAASIALTAPPAIQSWTLLPGQTNSYPNGNLVVKSNVNFQVTIVDANAANNGHLTEFDGTSFVAGGAQLLSPITIQLDSTPTSVSVSGSPQQYVSGLRTQADPTGGFTFPITFKQVVGFNDAPLNAPHYYSEVVTFAAAGSF